MNFLDELKRRNVFKVGGAYLVVSWLIAQVIAVVNAPLNLPDWFDTVVILLLLIGLPIALLIAWAFELTPDGIKATASVAEEDSIRPQTGQKLNRLIISGLSLALVLVIVDAYVLTPGEPGSTESASASELTFDPNTSNAIFDVVDAKSIAVLPFANLSNDDDQEYFSDGLTEELINKLSQVGDLQVTGRNSSFYYKGRDEELREIGSALGVANILQGSVRKAGNQVRITAQLMDVASNTNLWSENFDRDMDDIFMVQDEIAEAITTALSITISAGEFSQPGMTNNIQAYEEYLQAMNEYRVFGPDSVQRAIDHIERAVNLDPDFARGWLLMGELYNRGAGTFLPRTELEPAFDRARQANMNARELAPDMPELALLDLQSPSITPVEREQLLQMLIEAPGPLYAEVANRYGTFLSDVGRVNEALAMGIQARRLNPLDAQYAWQLAIEYLNLGRYNEAIAEINRGLTLDGREDFLLGLRFTAALQTGNVELAIQELEDFYSRPGITNPPQHQLNAIELWKANDITALQALIEPLLRDENSSSLMMNILGQFAIAIGVPELAIEVGRPTGMWMPYMAEGRKLPAFKEFVREIGLVDYWRASGNWADYCRPIEGNDDFECF
jgi:TolB-like protein